jgi:hypothetical protein
VQIQAVSTNSTALYVVPLRWADAKATKFHDGVSKKRSMVAPLIGMPSYTSGTVGVSFEALPSRHLNYSSTFDGLSIWRRCFK